MGYPLIRSMPYFVILILFILCNSPVIAENQSKLSNEYFNNTSYPDFTSPFLNSSGFISFNHKPNNQSQLIITNSTDYGIQATDLKTAAGTVLVPITPTPYGEGYNYHDPLHPEFDYYIYNPGTYILGNSYSTDRNAIFAYNPWAEGDIIIDGNGQKITDIEGGHSAISADWSRDWDCTVKNFNGISNFYDGIDLWGGRGEISNNILYNCSGWGIRAIYAFYDSSIVSENTVFNSGVGIINNGFLFKLQDNHVYNNSVGIDAFYNCDILNNHIERNSIGAYIGMVTHRFSENNVNNNDIGIIAGSGHNITNNNIYENNCGIRVNVGYAGLNISNNKIYNNRLIGTYLENLTSNGNGNINNNYYSNIKNIEGDKVTNFNLTKPDGPTLGTNIMGGPYIAGNYWSNPDGMGWSDLQPPDPKGYMTVLYEVTLGVNDTAPLVKTGYPTVTPTPTPIIHTIIAIATSGGKIEPSGTVSVVHGGTQSFTFTPDEGYSIASVTVDGQPVSTVSPYTFSNVIQDHTISVTFTGQEEIDVTIESFPDGAVIVLDGESIQDVTPTKIKLKPGRHSIGLCTTDLIIKNQLIFEGFFEVQPTPTEQTFRATLYKRPSIDFDKSSENITGHEKNVYVYYSPTEQTGQNAFRAELNIYNKKTGVLEKNLYAPALSNSLNLPYQDTSSFTIPWTPDLGNYGDKTISGTIYYKTKEWNTGSTPVVSSDVKVLFDILKWDPINKKYPSHFVVDYSIAKDPGNKYPNWFEYWNRDKVVNNLDQFEYRANGKVIVKVDGKDEVHPVFGLWYHTDTHKFYITSSALANFKHDFAVSRTGLPYELVGFSSGGGTSYPALIAQIVNHELQHADTYDNYKRGQIDTDNDYIGDIFEDDLWEQKPYTSIEKPFWTNIDDNDTYSLGRSFGGLNPVKLPFWKNYLSEVYRKHGDSELLSRYAEERVRNNLNNYYNSENDYSYSPFFPVASNTATKQIFTASSSVSEDNITSPYSFIPIDRNNDGLFDLLNISFNSNINQTGAYNIECLINNSTGTTITSSGTNIGQVARGQYSLSLDIPGEEIGRNGKDPATARLQLFRFDHDSDLIYETPSIPIPSPPSYTEFTGNQLTLTNTNTDKLTSSRDIEIGVGVKVQQKGNYTVYGMLWDKNNNALGGSYTATTLTPVNTSVPLTFGSRMLLDNQVDGPLTLQNLTIRDDTGVEFATNFTPYTTKSYTITDILSKSMGYISGSDNGWDINNDGKYEWMNLSLNCTVTVPGNYLLSFNLLDKNKILINQYTRNAYAGTGSFTWLISIPGDIFVKRGENSNYTISSLEILNTTSQQVDFRKSAFTTRWYNASDFAPVPNGTRTITSINPSVWTGDPSTTYSVKGSGFTSDSRIVLDRTGYNQVSATKTTCVSPHELECMFDLTNVRSGKWNVSVIANDAVQATLINGFTITNVNPTPTVTPTPITTGYYINSTSDKWTISYPSGNKTYPEESNQTFITQSKPGADLLDVIVDEQSKGVNKSHTFTNITSDHSIQTIGNAIPHQVHIMFNATPQTGKIPLSVEFIDESLGAPNTWYWQFGDGVDSSEKNPIHTYTRPGIYTVSLRAYSNNSGGMGIMNKMIKVTE